jgi:hypothetical protein
MNAGCFVFRVLTRRMRPVVRFAEGLAAIFVTDYDCDIPAVLAEIATSVKGRRRAGKYRFDGVGVHVKWSFATKVAVANDSMVSAFGAARVNFSQVLALWVTLSTL